MRSDATKLSYTDYEDIMQYSKIVSKPLEELRKKYHISNKRLYQIWRGEEVNRIEWNEPFAQYAIAKKPGCSASENPMTEISAGPTCQSLKAIPEEQSTSLPATEIPKKNGRKKKAKIDEKLVIGASSMVEKNSMTSSADNLSDISREDRVDSLLKNLVNRGEKLKGLTANTTPLI